MFFFFCGGGFHSLLFMLTERSLFLIHSRDCLEINVPEGAVFGQSGWILSSTAEALSWGGLAGVVEKKREWMLHMHIPKADTLNHINASAAHYYVLIANG